MSYEKKIIHSQLGIPTRNIVIKINSIFKNMDCLNVHQHQKNK